MSDEPSGKFLTEMEEMFYVYDTQVEWLTDRRERLGLDKETDVVFWMLTVDEIERLNEALGDYEDEVLRALVEQWKITAELYGQATSDK